jgi:16S rRNA (guanine527-N7)-methyltransferase
VAHDPKIIAVLDQALAALPSQADPNTSERLAAMVELVESWGARMNLTGHRSAIEIASALVADAVGLLAELERFAGAPLEGVLADLGSGAGFPGLPFAIVRPELDVRMVESREKRHYFQRAVRRQVDVPNAHPIQGRIEEGLVIGADWVVAQAVGPIAEVIAAMAPIARPGGRLVVPGTERLEAPARLGAFAGEVIRYRSPVLELPRTLWIGTRPVS